MAKYIYYYVWKNKDKQVSGGDWLTEIDPNTPGSTLFINDQRYGINWGRELLQFKI